MARIAEERYDLNISRDISPATVGEGTVLEEANAKLVKLEKKIKVAKDKRNDFLRQLGQPTLP
jgi:type I restriction enzyme M protein